MKNKKVTFSVKRKFIRELNTRHLFNSDSIPYSEFIQDNKDVRRAVFERLSDGYFEGLYPLKRDPLIIDIRAFKALLHNSIKEVPDTFYNEAKEIIEDVGIEALTDKMITEGIKDLGNKVYDTGNLTLLESREKGEPSWHDRRNNFYSIERKLSKIQKECKIPPVQDTRVEGSRTKKSIEIIFKQMDNKGWKYAFMSV